MSFRSRACEQLGDNIPVQMHTQCWHANHAAANACSVMQGFAQNNTVSPSKFELEWHNSLPML